MKMQGIVPIIALGLVVIVFVYIFNFTTEGSDIVKVLETCKAICNGELAKNVDLSNGPCLLNPVPNYKDWVCDVAHSPREPTDALTENQCSEYGKTAEHFVEVFPNCSFIRAI